MNFGNHDWHISKVGMQILHFIKVQTNTELSGGDGGIYAFLYLMEQCNQELLIFGGQKTYLTL
jgi:hypothetical protein